VKEVWSMVLDGLEHRFVSHNHAHIYFLSGGKYIEEDSIKKLNLNDFGMPFLSMFVGVFDYLATIIFF